MPTVLAWMVDGGWDYNFVWLIFTYILSLFKNNLIEINADAENVNPLDIVEELIVCRKNVRK